MKSRIGLFTPKPPITPGKKRGESTTAIYVEVGNLADLAAALAQHKADKVALFWRDSIGAGHLEGDLFAAADLKAEHLAWVTAKTETFQMRGLYFETA